MLTSLAPSPMASVTAFKLSFTSWTTRAYRQNATVIEQDRAGRGGAGRSEESQGRAEQSRAEQSRAEQGRAGQGRAGQGRADYYPKFHLL